MFNAYLLGLAVATSVAAAPDGSTDADRSAYEAAATAAGRDPEAQVKLALWCEAHGMPAERLKHLTRAVLLDPNNAKARGLLGQVQRDGKWMRADDVAKAVESSPEQSALMSEYLERRARTVDKADDQYKLALWCEEHGLTQPMLAHLHRTLQLDPDREGALRRLGFKKVGGRWVNPEAQAVAKAESEAQADADKEWTPKLEKIRAALTAKDRAKRAEAEVALAAITDPRAVHSIWRVFGRGGDEARQRLALGPLGRIEGPAASAALATLAVFSPHATIRSEAGSLLRLRDPRDFARFLASLVRGEVKYKVKPIDGPGGQGGLFVEGKDAKILRRYTPMPRPALPDGVQVTTGADGLSVAMIPLNITEPRYDNNRPGYALPDLLAARDRMEAVGRAAQSGSPSVLQDAIAKSSQAPPMRRGIYQDSPIYENYLSIPIGRMQEEARLSALAARQQLQRDVEELEAVNAPVRERNERATAVLKDVSGRDYGDDPEKWTGWAIDLEGYASQTSSSTTEPPTYIEDVPLAFTPQAGPAIVSQQIGSVITRHACFAAGMMVRTLQGPKPIETIQAGDQVLAQDTTTGEFRYQAVETAYHNPPNETFRIALGGDEVVATGIHRFWKAGQGWVMARELRPGDRLRTVGGSTVVQAVEKDRVQPVFNLALVGGDAFCVGTQGVVAHDSSFVAPVLSPFDAVAELASAGKP